MQRRPLLAAVFGALTLLGLTAQPAAAADDKPGVIRISFPGAGSGGRPLSGGSYPANAHLFKEIDDEFKADGIRIDWTSLSAMATCR